MSIVASSSTQDVALTDAHYSGWSIDVSGLEQLSWPAETSSPVQISYALWQALLPPSFSRECCFLRLAWLPMPPSQPAAELL
jgi:hypothetical protein